MLDDGRATDPVNRLLEDSWDTRTDRASRREMVVELVAAALFVSVSVPLAVSSLGTHHIAVGLALLLVGLYAFVAGTIRFPIGAGYVVPAYVMLVPMLVLLPPQTVPLLAAAGVAAASLIRWAIGRGSIDRVLFSIPDASYTLGPALVLSIASPLHGGLETAGIYLAAFLAGCVTDLAVSTAREAFALAVTPQLQLRVVASVWLIDACIAPLGLILAYASRNDYPLLLTVLPLSALLLMLDRDRNNRIAQAQHRLELVKRERTRLQAAVGRLGDALASKLDFPSLTSIVLDGSIEALDADAGQLTVNVPDHPPLVQVTGAAALRPLLESTAMAAQTSGRPAQLENDGVWALALPLVPIGADDEVRGALTVSRRERKFREDEQALMVGLLERAQTAVRDILAHERIREQAVTDPLTRLGNRRKLATDLTDALAKVSTTSADPIVLMMFDLDGFKRYNDTFGHLAGDTLLARLGGKLGDTVGEWGTAYRIGGDEFCVLLQAAPDQLHGIVTAAARALHEDGGTFSIHASCGAVLLPHEATTPDYALQLADQRMFGQKHRRRFSAREQTRDVLVGIIQAKQPELLGHSNGVARLAVAVGRRMGLNGEDIDELTRAADLHDIGKVSIPDAILDKPGPLTEADWEFVRQHTIVGERILSAAPALRPVATVVRATHERWDGRGYPDRLAGSAIPLAARIIAVCDAFDAMTSDRVYRKARTATAAREELIREAGNQFDPVVVEAVLAELDDPRHSLGTATANDEREPWLMAQEVADRVLEVLG